MGTGNRVSGGPLRATDRDGLALMIVIDLPIAPPSLNKWQRMHWAARKALSMLLRVELGARIAMLGPERVRVAEITSLGVLLVLRKCAAGPRAVRITRLSPRQLDHDNLVGGCKVLVDALKTVGIIEDDTPALVNVEYLQERGPKGCRVEVWDPKEES